MVHCSNSFFFFFFLLMISFCFLYFLFYLFFFFASLFGRSIQWTSSVNSVCEERRESSLLTSSSSSSCRATSTDTRDPLSPLLPYRSSPPAGLLLAVCMFELVVLFFLGHMWGSIGVHHLWAGPCFSSSVLHVWFV